MAGAESKAKKLRKEARRMLGDVRNEALEGIQSKGSPAGLHAIGPLLPGYWCVPEARRVALERAGKKAADPQYGAFLIDTGAHFSCIDDEVALELGLDTVGSRDSFGNGGLVRRRVVQAVMLIPLKGKRAVIYPDSFASVPTLRNAFRLLGPRWNGEGIDVIGLLGRDILRSGVFHYDGRSGSHIVYLDKAHMAPMDPARAESITGVRSPRPPR